MNTLAPPIPFSAEDRERRRLESTIDHDLSSLSFTASTSFVSGSSSLSTIPVARSAHVNAMSPAGEYEYPRFPSTLSRGAEDTPRANRGAASFAHTDFSEGPGHSPTSTAGHHVSAATLGAGVFKRGTMQRDRTGDEFDPDRSLGRLVGQLTKAMGEERIGPKPASPFVSPRSPHSPSPAPSTLPNLSFQLTRNEPPLSPPQSRTVSSSSSGSQRQRSITPPSKETQHQAHRTPLVENGRHNHNHHSAVPSQPSAKDKGRFKAPIIVPVINNQANTSHLRHNTTTGDITGLTGLLATPAKGAQFDDLNKNGTDIGSGAAIPQALATLHARIRALETENGVSRRRIRELEAEVERAREEVVNATREHDGRLREALSEKTALEELVSSLRENLKRLTIELEENKALVSRLRMAAQQPPSPVRKYDESVRDELAELRKEVERLSREVVKLNQIAEAGLAERTRAREQRSVRINALDLHDQDEVDRVRADVDRRAADFSQPLPSQLRQGLHVAAAAEPKLMPPSAGPPSRVADDQAVDVATSPSPPTRTRALHTVTVTSPTHSVVSNVSQLSHHSVHSHHSHHSNHSNHSVQSAHSAHSNHSGHSHKTASTTSTRRRRHKERKDGPDSPFPSIRAEDEDEFFSPRRPAPRPVSRAAVRHSAPAPAANTSLDARDASRIETNLAANETVRAILTDGNVPPQTVLARVIRELEDDFGHYKALYCELADQYKVLDAASVAAKRHVLAEHLKEVIDTLEAKADQIAALYSLLHYEDRPAGSTNSRPKQPRKSVRDLWRAVRESLPEDARRRLEADGLFRA